MSLERNLKISSETRDRFYTSLSMLYGVDLRDLHIGLRVGHPVLRLHPMLPWRLYVLLAGQYFNVRLRVFECGLLTRADPTRLFRCLAHCFMDFRKTAQILDFLPVVVKTWLAM